MFCKCLFDCCLMFVVCSGMFFYCLLSIFVVKYVKSVCFVKCVFLNELIKK